MAFQIKLYQFAKDENSTARPTGGTTFTGTLKEDSSIVDPVITFAMDAPPEYNYAYISQFGRYYWIDDWTYNTGFWTAAMKCDVLASWKTQIGNSTQYVTRAAAEFEGTITDGLLPMKTRPYQTNTYAELGTSPFSPDITTGFFMVGIFNNASSATGTVAYYAFSNSQFRSFCNSLMSTTFINDMGVSADEVSSNLLKALFNPIQYIASCIWFPFPMPSGTNVTQIPVGYWALQTSCRKLTSEAINKSYYISNIPHHPQSSSHGYYTRSAPYSAYKLVYPPFGTFDIPAGAFYDASELVMDFAIDLITGGAVLNIRTLNTIIGEYVTYTTMAVDVGVKIAMSQLTQDVRTLSGNAISSGAAQTTSRAVGAFVGAVAGIVNAATGADMGQNLTTFGGNGGRAAYAWGAYVVSTFCEVVDKDNDRFGRPLCKSRKISTLGATDSHSGYIMCDHVELHNVPATATELDQITTYMEAGFFYA